MLVVAVHAFNYTGTSRIGRIADTFARSGWTGVTLFFVLSGFLISGILMDTMKRKHQLRDFYARRSLRIFPLYCAFLVVNFFVVPHSPLASQYLTQPLAEHKFHTGRT